MLVHAGRSHLACLHTRDRYMASVSRTPYFRGLATNAQVITTVIELMEDQEVKETGAAWLFLLAQRDFGHDVHSLDLASARWFGQLGLAVNFDVGDAVGKLREGGLVLDDAHGGDDAHGALIAVWPRLARPMLAERCGDLFPTYHEEHDGDVPHVPDLLAPFFKATAVDISDIRGLRAPTLAAAPGPGWLSTAQLKRVQRARRLRMRSARRNDLEAPKVPFQILVPRNHRLTPGMGVITVPGTVLIPESVRALQMHASIGDRGRSRSASSPGPSLEGRSSGSSAVCVTSSDPAESAGLSGIRRLP